MEQPLSPSLSIVRHSKVIKGFGRGSKELGIPTANLDNEAAESMSSELDTGIYYGYAKLHGVVYQMVMSYGWNPFYKNSKRSCEVHLLATLEDFYDAPLTILVLGYIRPELDYTGVEALIEDINLDIKTAKDTLQAEAYSSSKSLIYSHSKAIGWFPLILLCHDMCFHVLDG